MSEGLGVRVSDLESRVALLEAFVNGVRSSEHIEWSPIVPDWQYIYYKATSGGVSDADE